MIAHRGPRNAEIVVIGNQPTQDDINQGKAFSGDQGLTIRDLMGMAGFDMSNVLFTNAVSYRRRSTAPFTSDEILDDAYDHLIPLILEHPRKLLVVMGNNGVVATGVSKEAKGVTTLRMKRLQTKFRKNGKPLFDAPIVTTTNPWILMKDPDEIDDFMTDLSFMVKILSGNFEEQVPKIVRDIARPEDIHELLEISKRDYPIIAYDHETDTLDRDRATVVMSSFCNGQKTDAGEEIGWVWGGYDRMRQRFEEPEMRRFRDAFDGLYSNAGDGYDLIGFNTYGFDDWVTETMLGHRIPGCRFDVMYLKWLVNNGGGGKDDRTKGNDLKSNVARYLGYPNYEAKVKAAFDAIKKRRDKVLEDPDDFATLRRWGVEPVQVLSGRKGPNYGKPTGAMKWPLDLLDKGTEGYALIDYDVLYEYAAFDAIYTRMLFDALWPMVEHFKLKRSCKLRHRIGRLLMRAEQRGLYTNEDTNAEFEVGLQAVEDDCMANMKSIVAKTNPEIEEFNPRSPLQLYSVLYGEPTVVPNLDPDHIIDHLSDKADRWAEKDALNKAGVFQERFYGGESLSVIRDAAKGGEVDYSLFDRNMKAAYEIEFGYRPRTIARKVYVSGLYEPIVFTKTGLPSTSTLVLKTLLEMKEDPFLSYLLMYARANKLNGTFVKAIRKKLKNGVLHGRYNAIGTRTGRISSNSPNTQNYVSYLRGQHIPRPGYRFLEFDLSAAEVRVVAAYSGDPALIEAVDAEDIHKRVASIVLQKPEEDITKEERRAAKSVVFGLLYGQGVGALALATNMSLEDAQAFQDRFFARFPGLKRWLERQVVNARKPPHKAYTPWGTMASVRGVLSTDWGTKGHVERVATNMPIQGAAGELTLYYACEIMDECDRRGWDIHLVNTTHDSVALEVPEHMVSKEPTIDPETGEQKIKDKKPVWTVLGPVAELVEEIIARPAPVAPLDKVRFVADLELNDHWSGEPDLKEALQAKGTFRWDLLKPGILDPEEQAEFDEIDFETLTLA